MRKTKSTKQALLMSVMSLMLCISMLVGTTFAWFTDSVTSGVNTIKAGNLDVELEYLVDGKWEKVTEQTNVFAEDTLWEPGHTEVVYLKVSNLGTLSLKYKLCVNVASEVESINKAGDPLKLSKYIEYDVIKGVSAPYATRDAARKAVADDTTVEPVRLDEKAYYQSGVLYSTTDPAATKPTEEYVALVVYMPEEIGNEANYRTGEAVPEITLGIDLQATQFTYEEDSFDEMYDKEAALVGNASGVAAVGAVALEIQVRNYEGTKVGSVVVDIDAVDDTSKPVEVNYNPSAYEGNFTIADGMETKVVDITVSNLKANNTEPIKVAIRIEAGKDPDTVKLYHYDEEIQDIVYDPNTGYVTFETTSFSPFTVVYDADSEYVQDGLPADLPEAKVVNSPEYENVDLPWGSYGAWSPTEGLDSQLEAAYTFTCMETGAEAKENPYANWYCDFYVVLNKDLGENQIFLGGNYGSFGWVGFHNGDLTLDANTEIPLLGSVTTNPWTYAQVAEYVGTFICGVGDVDDALSGATFKVMLRLTNPEDETEFYNAATIEYVFN